MQAQLPPLKIKLNFDAKPVRIKWQKFSQDQQEFMEQLIKRLLENSIIYRKIFF